MGIVANRAIIGTLAPALGMIFVVSCGDDDDCRASRTCGATAGTSPAGSAGKSGSGGTDAGGSNGGSSGTSGSSNTSGSAGVMGNGGDGGAGGSACTGDVSDDSACWTTNDLGVFVSSDTGDDTTGNGTKEMPFKTITKGIASASGKNVYVCVGAADYSEKISLDQGSDGIHIYGGFECSGWTYATTRSAQVLSPSNIALRIDGLKKGAHIENVSFKAADATGTGTDASSYGAFVTSSKGVEFTRVELTAGDGAKGEDGADGPVGHSGSESGSPPSGADAFCGVLAEPPLGGHWLSESPWGSLGGDGASGHKNSTNGASGAAGSPSEHVTPLSGIENGGPGATDKLKGQDGLQGTEGDPGELGAAAPTEGAFSLVGYASADGLPGASGYPGQGGGGGGASKGNGACYGASGGAGGMGGGGGGGGKGGSGGGASVGLFSWSSAVSLEACTVASAVGGTGGAGGRGGIHGAGALGGAGGNEFSDPDNAIARGGQGGFGGPGGNGGSGSGGTGGPSYAVAYSGTKPSYEGTDTTLMSGTPGAAGVGGQVLLIQAPNGSVGQSAQEFPVP